MSEKKYKFGHLFYAEESESIFISRFIDLLYKSDNGINADEHIFFTYYESVYNKFRDYNIMLIPSSETFAGNVANKCMKYVDVLFCHGLCSPLHTLIIKKSTMKSMVWRTWGAEIFYKPDTSFSIKNIVKRILYPICLNRLNNIFMIGSANIVDEISTKKFLNNPKYCDVPYIVYRMKNLTRHVRNIELRKKKANVLVGHSGYPGDNHIEMIKKLASYKGKVSVYVPLSYYRDDGRIEAIKKVGFELFGDDFKPIEKFMPYEEYMEFLKEMDISIFDGKVSYALGNISVLLAYGKKIYLNKDGIIAEAFDAENIPYSTTDMLGAEDYNTFISCEDYSDNLEKSSFKRKTYSEYVSDFRDLLDEIKTLKSI